MPITTADFHSSLYDLLRTKGYQPIPLDSKGKTSPFYPEADIFKFSFVKDGKKYGDVWATVDNGGKLVLYYDDEVSSSPSSNTKGVEEGVEEGVEVGDSWPALLKHLKRWGQRRQLGFELKNKDHLVPDMQLREYARKKEQLGEGYYPMGKKASYNDAIPQVKIVIQHSKQLGEGEQRFRYVEKIFVENTEGERFAVPTKKPGLAKIYARHVAEGGTPYDDRGRHLTSLIEEYSKMVGFVRATKYGEFNESVQRVVNAGVDHYQSLRETLGKLTSHRGYHSYFDSWSPVLNEEQSDLSEISTLFTKSNLDPRIESCIPILSKLTKLDEIKPVRELDSWADEVISETTGLPPASLPRNVSYRDKKKMLQHLQGELEGHRAEKGKEGALAHYQNQLKHGDEGVAEGIQDELESDPKKHQAHIQDVDRQIRAAGWEDSSESELPVAYANMKLARGYFDPNDPSLYDPTDPDKPKPGMKWPMYWFKKENPNNPKDPYAILWVPKFNTIYVHSEGKTGRFTTFLPDDLKLVISQGPKQAADTSQKSRNQGVAEGSRDKVHLKTPKYGLADHPGRNTGVGLRTFAQTPEQDRCSKCNTLYKNHYKQGVAEGWDKGNGAESLWKHYVKPALKRRDIKGPFKTTLEFENFLSHVSPPGPMADILPDIFFNADQQKRKAILQSINNYIKHDTGSMSETSFKGVAEGEVVEFSLPKAIQNLALEWVEYTYLEDGPEQERIENELSKKGFDIDFSDDGNALLLTHSKTGKEFLVQIPEKMQELAEGLLNEDPLLIKNLTKQLYSFFTQKKLPVTIRTDWDGHAFPPPGKVFSKGEIDSRAPILILTPKTGDIIAVRYYRETIVDALKAAGNRGAHYRDKAEINALLNTWSNEIKRIIPDTMEVAFQDEDNFGFYTMWIRMKTTKKGGYVQPGAQKPAAPATGAAPATPQQKVAETETHESLNPQQKKVGQLGPLEKAKNISPVLGKKEKQHPFQGKLVGASESIDPELKRIKTLLKHNKE